MIAPGSLLTALPFSLTVGALAAYLLGIYFRKTIRVEDDRMQLTNVFGSVRVDFALYDIRAVDEQRGEGSHLRIHLRDGRMILVTESLRDYALFSAELKRMTSSPES